MILLLALLACEPPRFAHLSESLQQQEAGLAALEAGDAEEAVARMKAATQANPASAELWLWLGTAQARAGQREAAIASASKALELRPRWPLALYNRACWTLRGDIDEADLQRAAADLRPALAAQVLNPMDVALDPDLEPLRAHPELSALLPAAALPFEVQASAEPVFLGAEWVITLELAQGDWPAPALELVGSPSLPARVHSVVEEWQPGDPLGSRRLTLRLEVLGPGEGSLGPWRTRAAGLEGEAPATPYRFLALQGSDEVGSIDITENLVWPSQRLEGLKAPLVERRGEQVLVLGEPGDRAEWAQPPGDLVRYELRRDGSTLQVAWSGSSPPGSEVRLMRGRRAVLTATP